MNNFRFYIEKFVYSKKKDTPDLSFVPANTRRKLNTFDKHVIYMLNSCFEPECENIILSSRYGEYRRLFELVDKHNEFNESSPMMFSASVHNYILGQFTMLKQNTIPTSAVSAGKESFINGLVTAVTSPQKSLIYCYADDVESDILGMCFRIKKNGAGVNEGVNGKACLLKRSDGNKGFNTNEAVEFFEGKANRLELNDFCIERE